jgi:hypothetical protein
VLWGFGSKLTRERAVGEPIVSGGKSPGRLGVG